MRLRWEKYSAGFWYASAGSVGIGVVRELPNGGARYKIDGINMTDVGKRSGDVVSLQAAKRAVNRGWRRWIAAAGLAGDA